jgi:hypothetical protein
MAAKILSFPARKDQKKPEISCRYGRPYGYGYCVTSADVSRLLRASYNKPVKTEKGKSRET